MSFNKVVINPQSRLAPRAEKKFDHKVASLWHPKSGNPDILSVFITPEVLASIKELAAIAEVGGKLTITKVGEKSRPKVNSPNGYFNYVSKEDVDAFEASNKGSDSL